MQQKPLHVLVSPLDWGLGHAARCIPVVWQLLEAGHKVTLAGRGRSLIMLQKEFPTLGSIDLPGFSPTYSRSGNMVFHMFLLLPQFIGKIITEHRQLKRLNAQHHFDVMISDNRYGLWNKKITNILITHQVMIKTPRWLTFAEYMLYRVSLLFISRFDECWIPDEEKILGLSGDLSHKYRLPANARFVGPLTRFNPSAPSPAENPRNGKIIAVISGPEPQRGIFEELITKQLKESEIAATLIGGKPEYETNNLIEGGLTILPHLASIEMQSIISASLLVICRPGYSSIMDLQAIGAKALFVPTPGQTEQLYLAKLHNRAGNAFWKRQEDLNLRIDIPEALKFKGFKSKSTGNGLTSAIANLGKK